ncbi:1-deoxy-D-xylulose-5-phosphate synthase [Frankliniella fusca]|uniref:1-deoxy-D-xylulose-5-phosphate synthase n=1 Tax=Frankliniella fusca TaxID=407009 RepID=A0AAE1HMD7_9NEOP|nr:1-deoxy-D-xylulose-5-phosphate synthase [Frankliniella fusca]
MAGWVSPGLLPQGPQGSHRDWTGVGVGEVQSSWASGLVDAEASRMAAAVAGASSWNQPVSPSSARAAATASRMANMTEQAMKSGGSPTA